MDSSNGYSVIISERFDGPLPRLRMWSLPGTQLTFPLRDGAAGFVLMHWTHWLHNKVDDITMPIGDDFGWAPRKIAGTDIWSNHASGTAIDVDSTIHPWDAVGTWSGPDTQRIQDRLPKYKGCIRWGGNYKTNKDEMHFELDQDITAVQALALKLMTTRRGRRILRANPGAKKIISM